MQKRKLNQKQSSGRGSGSSVAVAVLLVLFAGIAGCGNRPEPVAGDTRVATPPSGAKAPAVWIATSDFQTNGWLSRIDLASGNIQLRVRETGSDVALAADGPGGFFLLARGSGESVTYLTGAGAVPSGSFPLANGSNPQHAARDGKGRVWVAAMESNSIEVLAADLKSRVGAVDVSALRDDSDGLAEPYAIVKLDGGFMGIAAARIQRPAWAPSAQSGAILVDENTLAVKDSRLLGVVNATLAFASGSGMLVVGSGALMPTNPLLGGIIVMGSGSLAAVETRALAGRVIHADLGPTGELAYIDWRPEEARSCIRYGLRELACDGHVPGQGSGYVFSRVLVAGDTVFAAWAKDQNSELWSIPVNGGQIQRLRMDQPVQSLVLGP